MDCGIIDVDESVKAIEMKTFQGPIPDVVSRRHKRLKQAVACGAAEFNTDPCVIPDDYLALRRLLDVGRINLPELCTHRLQDKMLYEAEKYGYRYTSRSVGGDRKVARYLPPPYDMDKNGSLVVVAFSDTHGDFPKDVPEGSVVVFCGDCCRSGSREEVYEFISRFAALPHKYKLLVPGNHDSPIESPAVQRYIAKCGIKLLIGTSITIEGVKFFGHPWVSYRPEHYNNAFSTSRRDMHIEPPQDTDVLITHFPPYGIGDTNTAATKGVSDNGDYKLRQWVESSNLKYHVFGHFHGGRGRYSYPTTNCVFINTAMSINVFRV